MRGGNRYEQELKTLINEKQKQYHTEEEADAAADELNNAVMSVYDYDKTNLSNDFKFKYQAYHGSPTFRYISQRSGDNYKVILSRGTN